MSRVAVVFPGRRGGTSRYAAELASGLSQRGFDVLGVASAFSIYKHLWPESTVFVPSYNNMSQALWFLASMRWRHMAIPVKRFRPDFVLYPGLFFWLPLVDSWIGPGKRIIAVHDVQLHPGQDDPARRWLNHWSFNRADVLVVLSQAQLQALPQRHRQKAVVIPHPVFTVKSKGQRSDQPTVLFMGRITRYKGLDTLTKAVDLLRKEMPELRLVVAGSGDISGYSLKDAEVLNRWLSEEEVCQLLSKAWVVALPYTQATQSGVAALAKGAGVPTVGSNLGGLSQQVDIPVRPGDPVALAQALHRVITQGVRPKPGPSWQEVLDMYQEVLK